MIEFQQVCKSYGAQDVLLEATFTVNPGEHVGIVGPNGAGKSTVFSLIVGDCVPDRGSVQVGGGQRLGYLRQYSAADGDMPLLEYVENAIPEIRDIQHQLELLEQAFHAREVENREQALRRHGELQTRFEALGGYELKTRAEIALAGLGFDESAWENPLRTLSGGWLMRAELARVLVSSPSILLLDEPSNYLDIPAVEWLQRYLRDFDGTLLLISHDRYLLNGLTQATLEIANAQATRYAGNYEHYVVDRQRRYEQSIGRAKNIDRKREQMERFVERFRSKNTLATRVKSKIKQIERLEDATVMKLAASRGRIRIKEPPHCGQEIVRLDRAGVTYDGSRWVLRGVNLRIEKGEKIALVGLNGLGKTTLLRVLAGERAPSAGKRVVGHKVIVGYQSQEFAETMNPHDTVLQTVRTVDSDSSEQELRSLLGSFGFSGDAVFKPVDVLSGGEKVRLAFARLLSNPPNFLLLDEPTTHLDIEARERLQEALQEYHGTLCMVSHDVEFVRQVANGIISMEPPGVRRWPGGYDYYRDKLAEQASAGGRPDSSGASGSVDRRKADRRERARLRQELRERTRDLKRRIARIEKQIETFEAERDRVLEQMADEAASVDYADLNRRLSTIQGEIENYTHEWECKAEALESIEQEYADAE